MDSLRKMMQKNQKAVIALVVVAGLFVLYNTFLKEDSSGPDLISESQGIRNLELGREIIVTLNRLKTINIDTGILEDPRFEKLQDFSQPLPKYSEGKQNPFELEIPGRSLGSVEVTSPALVEQVSQEVDITGTPVAN